jgi:tRNA dimethylallyltransferase
LKSIGAIETLTYLDGKISKELLYQQIVTNTYRLAKRQNTFNKSQFHNKQIKGNRDKLLNMMSDRLLNIM